MNPGSLWDISPEHRSRLAAAETGDEALASVGEDALRAVPRYAGFEAVEPGRERFAVQIANRNAGGLGWVVAFLAVFAGIFTSGVLLARDGPAPDADKLLIVAAVLCAITLALVLLTLCLRSMVVTISLQNGVMEVGSRTILWKRYRRLDGPPVEVSRFVAYSTGRTGQRTPVYRIQVSSERGRTSFGTGLDPAIQGWLMARLAGAINEFWEDHYAQHPEERFAPPRGSGIEVLRQEPSLLELRLGSTRWLDLIVLGLPWLIMGGGLFLAAHWMVFMYIFAVPFTGLGLYFLLRGMSQATLREELAVSPGRLSCRTKCVFFSRVAETAGGHVGIARHRTVSSVRNPIYEFQAGGSKGQRVRFGSGLSAVGQRWLIERIEGVLRARNP